MTDTHAKPIIFQQEATPDLQSPWPVVVDVDQSIVHGRPDARYLSGFGPKGAMDITVWAKDAIAEPELALGLVPTFAGDDGKLFAVDLEVKSIEVYGAGEDAIAVLRRREATMRDAFERIDQLGE